MNVCEYTTVDSAKETYSDVLSSQKDNIILRYIRQASREIENITNRRFYPLISTHRFDTPRAADVLFDDDLLEVATLTNGDGQVIGSDNYRLYPLNETPKYKLTLLSKSYVWLGDSSGNREGAVQVAGTWGFSADYGSAWEATTTLSAAINASVTSITVPSGSLSAGQLLRIGSEYLYVSAVEIGNPPDTLTVIRAVNGSTAAAHNQGDAVAVWNAGSDITNLINRAVAAYIKLRGNPLLETVNVDGVTFSTPKDVVKWMDAELRGMGLIRTGLA